MIYIDDLARKLWLMPTGNWLAAGVIAINAAASFPRGIADATPQEPITAFEKVQIVIFPCIVIGFLISIFKPRLRSWVATISGGIWFGFAIGAYLEYRHDISILIIIAYILFPLGVAFVSFALARIADLEAKARAEVDTEIVGE